MNELISVNLLNSAMLLASFWGLLKYTVGRELKQISESLEKLEAQGHGHANDLRSLDVRVAVLEVGGGRRRTDICHHPDCATESRQHKH